MGVTVQSSCAVRTAHAVAISVLGQAVSAVRTSKDTTSCVEQAHAAARTCVQPIIEVFEFISAAVTQGERADFLISCRTPPWQSLQITCACIGCCLQLEVFWSVALRCKAR